jgi:hypothetical protein
MIKKGAATGVDGIDLNLEILIGGGSCDNRFGEAH